MPIKLKIVEEIKEKSEIPYEWKLLKDSAKKAMAAGESTYFDGVKCKKGDHYSPKYQSNGNGKGCVTCSRLRIQAKTRAKRIAAGITDQGYSLEDFIREATIVHSGYYGYGQIKSFGYKTDKYTIVCPVHGKFTQSAQKHLSGQGCTPCKLKASGESQRLSQEEFLDRCIKTHGDTYDLSMINYSTAHENVLVGCKVAGHGFFETEANNFMRGLSGCKLCAAIKTSIRCRSSRLAFIKKARAKHGDRYGYDLVNYQTSKDDVTILCKVEGHGLFRQAASVHLSGSGCQKCAGVQRVKKLALTLKEFISRATEKHGETYDYSLVKLSSSSPAHSKVKIRCAKHGVFEQAPVVHFKSGCRKCHMEYLWNEVRAIGRSEWILRSSEQHRNKYDYSLVHPFDKVLDEEVQVICPLHGLFTQSARLHMVGRGCQKCGDLNRGRDGFYVFCRDDTWASVETEFYFVEVRNQFLKFGITVDYEDRARQDYTDVYYRIVLLRAEAWVLEQYMLKSTAWASPVSLPSDISGWGGATELRDKLLSIDDTSQEIDDLVELIMDIGWKSFYFKYLALEAK